MADPESGKDAKQDAGPDSQPGPGAPNKKSPLKAVATAAAPSAATPAPKKYTASISSSFEALPADLVSAIQDLEKALGMPVWMMVQNPSQPDLSPGFDLLDRSVCKALHEQRDQIVRGQPAAILLESPGGQADEAFRIARLFKRRVSALTVVVPQYAKSAATMLALGADTLYLGEDAELGPLDVQLVDMEREEVDSGLNAVQALERLNAFAITTFDQVSPLLRKRTGKKTDTVVQYAQRYVADMMRPLLEKIDVVDYSKKSRTLKVGEEYAIRLMQASYGRPTAERIARYLVEKYPDHGFVIDATEARAVGIKIAKNTPDLEKVFGRLMPFMDGATVIGRITEVTP